MADRRAGPVPDPSQDGGDVITQQRRERVEHAVENCVDQLIDLTGRNQLLYYRTLPRGTLELTNAQQHVCAALLSGATVRISRLFPLDHVDAVDDAYRRARTIHGKALALFEEKGIETLFMAYGIATWTTTTSKSTPAAPVLLRPLRLVPRGAAEAGFDVRLHGDWQVNETLLHLLRTDFRTEIDAGELQALSEAEPSGLDAVSSGVDAAAVFSRLIEQAGHVPDFAIDGRMVAGTFAYTKLPMVKDLRDNTDQLAAHDLIAAIAGAPDAQHALRELAARGTDVTRPDHTPPADEFHPRCGRVAECGDQRRGRPATTDHPRPAGHGEVADDREPDHHADRPRQAGAVCGGEAGGDRGGDQAPASGRAG